MLPQRRLAALRRHLQLAPSPTAAVSAADGPASGDAPLLTDAQHLQFKTEGFLNAGHIFEDDASQASRPCV